MIEQIEENAPHVDTIRCAINALVAAARQAKDVYNCTNESEYNSDAEECEKIAADLTALYNNITSREAANLHVAATKNCPFELDKPEEDGE